MGEISQHTTLQGYFHFSKMKLKFSFTFTFLLVVFMVFSSGNFLKSSGKTSFPTTSPICNQIFIVYYIKRLIFFFFGWNLIGVMAGETNESCLVPPIPIEVCNKETCVAHCIAEHVGCINCVCIDDKTCCCNS